MSALGVKRTFHIRDLRSANDPKQTWCLAYESELTPARLASAPSSVSALPAITTIGALTHRSATNESLASAFGEAGERVCGSVPPFPAKSSGPTLTTNDASTRPKEQGGSHGQECPLCRDWVRRAFLDSIGRRAPLPPG